MNLLILKVIPGYIYIRKIYLANATLTMFEKTMYLASMLLVQYRCHNN